MFFCGFSLVWIFLEVLHWNCCGQVHNQCPCNLWLHDDRLARFCSQSLNVRLICTSCSSTGCPILNSSVCLVKRNGFKITFTKLSGFENFKGHLDWHARLSIQNIYPSTCSNLDVLKRNCINFLNVMPQRMVTCKLSTWKILMGDKATRVRIGLLPSYREAKKDKLQNTSYPWLRVLDGWRDCFYS